jgi:hypothetical protein
MNSERSADMYIKSALDMLVVTLESSGRRVQDAIDDVSETEYNWEPIPLSERTFDLSLEPEVKKVWRVFQRDGEWIYDYTPEVLAKPPFTTIAWIMNHVAQTGAMYLYCVKTGIPEGVDRHWDDLPVHSDFKTMGQYIYRVLDDTGEYLKSIPLSQADTELNRLTPAPWGEMRPTYLNIWGGIIGHTIEHASQISFLKHKIRLGY